MKALVTRPADDAAPVAAVLRSRGIDPVIAPMLSIEPDREGAARIEDALAGVQAVLFTSANGVRAFAAASHRFELPAFCVGDASAAAARIANFRIVFNADGAVPDLAALVTAKLAPGNGALLHATGDVTAGDLATPLKEIGFVLRRHVLYRAVAATALSPDVASTLRRNEVELALFFSPRTAETFVRLVGAAGLGENCEKMVALALSQNVATALARIAWRMVRTAPSPKFAALLAMLDEVIAHERAGI